MQYVVHRNAERGRAAHGWLTSRFSFSFANWYEPTRMGFGTLRVINDDTVAPRSGFDSHHHKDMEIITIVTGGAVTHKDSAGNSGVVKAGDVQVMSAGTGVVHSEYNESPDTPLTLFQIWIMPKQLSIKPFYAQRSMGLEKQKEGLVTIVEPREGAHGDSLTINQDAWISHAVLASGMKLLYQVKKDRNGVYIFLIEGALEIGREQLNARDAIGITGESEVALRGVIPVRALIFDVPMN